MVRGFFKYPVILVGQFGTDDMGQLEKDAKRLDPTFELAGIEFEKPDGSQAFRYEKQDKKGKSVRCTQFIHYGEFLVWRDGSDFDVVRRDRMLESFVPEYEE